MLLHEPLSEGDVTSSFLAPGAIARLGIGCVNDMALSPDGSFLAVATSIGLWVYELSTMSPLGLWDSERSGISALSFSPDGRWLATGGYDGVVKVWDVHNRVCLAQMERWEEEERMVNRKAISQLAFSSEGCKLAVSGKRDYIVDFWHPETGEQLARFSGDSQTELRYCSLTRPVAFSPDGCLFACVSTDGTKSSTEPEADLISVWDVSSGERIALLTEYTDLAYSLCFSPCGCFLVAGGDVHGTLMLWNMESLQLHSTYPGHGGYRVIPSYSPDGILRVAEISDAAITVWDVKRDETLYSYPARGNTHYAQFFNGTHLAVASSEGLSVWRVGRLQPSTSPHVHPTSPESLAFSDDGKLLVSGHRDDGILLWNVAIPSQSPTVFHPSGIRHRVYASPGEKLYATSVDENTVKVWEVGSNMPIAAFVHETPPTYRAVAFSPRSHHLVCGDATGTLHVWDVQRREKVHTLTGHTMPVLTIEFSPDGKRFASNSDYGPDFRIWDVEHGKEIGDFPGNRIEKIAFSPCGEVIAGDTHDEILLWDVTRRQTFLAIRKPEKWVYNGLWQLAFAFSRCGRYLASGSCWDLGMAKVPVRLWEVASGEHIDTFWGHAKDIQTLAFSPDGSLLASGSLDGTILLWDMKPYLHHETS